VRTLHGLANDIVRERPALAGLVNSFTVIDEREADDILADAVATWLQAHPTALDDYLTPEAYSSDYVRGNPMLELVSAMASSFIRQAKDLQMSDVQMRERLTQFPHYSLAAMCCDIYEQYERSLRYRGAVDFQDLIRLALRVLVLDPDYLERLRQRWVYILEDEAQDSSQLQEQILRMLVGSSGNWVRVGDPNQAIFETFTTANPKFLREFLREPHVQAKTLPNSGRNTASIIRLANQLIEWSLKHPNPAIRARSPLTYPLIEPTPPGDPQGNPPDHPDGVFLIGEKVTADEERNRIVRSLRKWLPENQDKTVAVLVSSNNSGTKMVQELRAAGIEYVENLRSTSSTRAVVGSVSKILDHLLKPQDAGLLAEAYRVWRRNERGDEESERMINSVVNELRKIRYVEDFVAPRGLDWLEASAATQENSALLEHLQHFRSVMRRWHAAADLPIDQLVLTIAGDIFVLESELATAYSVALYLRRYAELHPQEHLPHFLEELRMIVQGKRNFSGVSDDDDAFDPDRHRGKVTVMTMHKAKGLEWDRVYMMSVNNYVFPSDDPNDTYMSEKRFIRDHLNMEAEATGQLWALTDGSAYQEGQATQAARVDYAAERLRLLYVGITRARRELILTWNTGKGEQVEARPMAALRGWWEQERTKR
jgi:DNA helicase-2/ATP-dependent DNA helicase PcrA